MEEVKCVVVEVDAFVGDRVGNPADTVLVLCLSKLARQTRGELAYCVSSFYQPSIVLNTRLSLRISML